MYKSILVAVDGSDHANKALDAASRLAQNQDAKLSLCHVMGSGPVPESLQHMAEIEHIADIGRGASVQEVGNVMGNLAVSGGRRVHPYVDYKVHQAIGHQILDEAAERAHTLGAERIEKVLTEGDPGPAILEAADAAQADIVVLGSRGISNLKGLLMGSVSQKVCQFAACPCLVVP